MNFMSKSFDDNLADFLLAVSTDILNRKKLYNTNVLAAHLIFKMAAIEDKIAGHHLNELIKETVDNAELRTQYGSDENVWAAIANALDGNDDLPLLYKFITNIAACEKAGSLASQQGVISKLVQQAKTYQSPQLWRALSNLNQTSPDDLAGLDIDYGKALSSATMPTLRLIEANVRKFPESSVVFANNGVLMALLSQVNDWYDSNEVAFQIVTRIFIYTIEAGLAPMVMDDIVSIQMIARSVALQKVLDAALSVCHERISEPIAHDLSLVLAKYTKHVCQAALPYFFDPESRKTPEAIFWWTWLISNIESLTLIAMSAREELNDESFGLVQQLVSVLIAAKQLPQHNKLGKGDHELDPSDFPMIKTTIIPLLSILVAQNEWAQTYCRTDGGLLAILEACTVDENNPFVREKAIVCVRYLLQDNQENQEFVAKLEAKKVVNPEVLEKAGYEAEIIDGQISVKTNK